MVTSLVPSLLHDSAPGIPTCLTERDAERALSLAERTLTARRLRRQSVPPHFRIGKRIAYPLDQLRKWIETQAIGGGVML